MIKLRKNQTSFPTEVLFEEAWESLEIQAEGIEKLPHSLSELKTLRSLSLNCPNLIELSPQLLESAALEIFKMRNTSFEVLPEVENPSPFKTLFLSGNKLKHTPNWFSKLPHLKLLDLSGNNLCTVPDEVSSMISLSRLVLDRNEITQLPNFLKALKNLSHLSVDGNKFDENEKVRIRKEFGIWFN
jgi:Leucine-rich repeat (LRR) protein